MERAESWAQGICRSLRFFLRTRTKRKHRERVVKLRNAAHGPERSLTEITEITEDQRDHPCKRAGLECTRATDGERCWSLVL